jgi:hypothetical protein
MRGSLRHHGIAGADRAPSRALASHELTPVRIHRTLRQVRFLLPRVVSAIVALVLTAGGVSLCAGWEATADARMACCTKRSACAMRRGTADSKATRVTQAQADACCATADRPESTPSSTAIVVHPPLVSVAALVVALASTTTLEPEWGSATSPPGFRIGVPRHLLLSVFLI